jgi:hypothetical protein
MSSANVRPPSSIATATARSNRAWSSIASTCRSERALGGRGLFLVLSRTQPVAAFRDYLPADRRRTLGAKNDEGTITTTVRILGSRAREQFPGTSITLLAPGFLGSLTQVSAAEAAPCPMPDLPFADVAEGANVMLAAHLTMQLEARPPDDGPGLRSRSAVAAYPRLIVPRRNGVAYALLQTDAVGISRFVMPLARDDDDEAVFPLTVPRDGATRRTLRVFMWAAQPVQGPGAFAVAARWERLRRPNQLVRLDANGDWQRTDANDCARGPCLLLLHDTFGTPQSSFTDWLSDEAFAQFFARYGGRCLAFAHPTLATGIAENADWLDANLPAGMPALDVVAHGRGGLVARALAARTRVPVRRGVLVGTPNYGTPLARPDQVARLLDGNAARLALVPRVGARATLEGLLGMARLVALGLSSRLPGLEAQEPGSDTLRMLDATVSPTHWFSIGANLERSDERSSDPLLGDVPNDLVVPSDGCHLATATPDDSLRIAGPRIHHHNYFSSAVVRNRLRSWLL